MSSLTKRVQQIEKRVDHPPGHITAERFHQQSAGTATASPARIARACLRESHDELKQELQILSTGSSTRLGFLIKLVDIPKVRSLNLRGSLRFVNFYRQ